METITSYVASTRPWAAFPAARPEWGIPFALGDDHALGLCSVLAVGNPEMQGAPAAAMTSAPLAVAQAAAQLFVNGTRKQIVNKTRLNAGGYGTLGPHPEREPA